MLSNNLFTTHRLLGWCLLTPHIHINTTFPLLPRKWAYVLIFMGGCSLPPPPSSKASICCLFSRVVALCHHHHHPPPLKQVHMLVSRLVALCHSPYLPSPAKKSSIILLIIYFVFYLQNSDPDPSSQSYLPQLLTNHWQPVCSTLIISVLNYLNY